MRLSDIEILGAIGDSDTAAFAARSTGIHTYFTGGFLSNSLITDKKTNRAIFDVNMLSLADYFGASFATGTDGNWRTSPTLANILRTCNPSLTGELLVKDKFTITS